MTNFSRRRFLQLAANAAALPAVARLASAQTYPSRPITVIVPTGAGGPQDVIARSASAASRARNPMAIRLASAFPLPHTFSMQRCMHSPTT
jgi:tripartite-type tricarboxylate transporter receptor subunit TctC